MKKLTFEEFSHYLGTFGLLPLVMPFLLFMVLGILLGPLLVISYTTKLSSILSPIMNIFYPIILYTISIVGTSLLFYFLIRNLKKCFVHLRIWLFTIIFLVSGISNFFFTYFICSFSLFTRCNPNEYLTLAGFLGINDFYIICLIVFIVYNIYLAKFKKVS